ncbi:DUF2127 domain-containing protein [Terrimesophilobacter mesophilus]|uniref:DUF2127 domain-containing protein n=1 Tax=Terrimesophilobacter mesophilus TaxID=433647 RepID=UPI00142598DB|nr:DUF2127 domain-containing protein [Terrimesophilobacter mesophilus]
MNRAGDRPELSTTTWLDRIFWAVLVLKGLDGVLELVGGILLLAVSPERISAIARILTQHELSEDPNDLIATNLLRLTNGLGASATLFGAAYLLLHGLVKVVLVWAVLRDRLWAYPWMIGFLVVFVGYQAYQLVLDFSWWLLLLTVFDIVMVVLTWREYGIHRARRRGQNSFSGTPPGT